MKSSIITVAVLFTCAGLHAQPDGYPLTIGEAYRRTMSDNPEIEAIYYEQKAAAEETRAAAGLRSPKVGVDAAYVHLQDRWGYYLNDLKAPVGTAFEKIASTGLLPEQVVNAAQGLLSKDWGITLLRRDFASVGGTVTVPIFTGGKINAANAAARINEQVVSEQGAQAKNALVSELAERYYGLILARSAVQVRRQVLDAMNEHLRDAVALEQNGMIARSARLYIEVKVTEAERDLNAAILNEQNIMSALQNTLGEVRDFVPVSRIFILQSLESLPYFQQLAYANNPLLRQVSLQRDLARVNVKLQRSEYYPQIAALGAASFYRWHLSDNVPKWAVGAGVKINIFDGLARERKISAAKYTVRRVESLEQKAASQIELLIENLYNELINIHDKIPSIDKSLEFAAEYLRIQSVGFREGVVSATDVIDAELNLAAIKIEKLTAGFLYDVLLARLLEASGVSESFVNYAENGFTEHIYFEEL